jgi:hypothetical protein
MRTKGKLKLFIIKFRVHICVILISSLSSVFCLGRLIFNTLYFGVFYLIKLDQLNDREIYTMFFSILSILLLFGLCIVRKQTYLINLILLVICLKIFWNELIEFSVDNSDNDSFYSIVSLGFEPISIVSLIPLIYFLNRSS